jgi:hypothetical protein
MLTPRAVPPYIGAEDITLATPPPTFTPQPEQFSLAGGDYEQLQGLLYEDIMRPVRRELAFRGLGESTAMAQASVRAGEAATRQAIPLQQDEQMRAWQRELQSHQEQTQQWQLAQMTQQQEALQRRQWLWDTYMLPQQEYWQHIDALLRSIEIPFRTVPYYQPPVQYQL